ncbi:hypothetical protein [Roseovarius sp. M141]|uniref:hypothetical protein n=1 Tax=Roseovarius sp. M141 TaxID=2583806 RepID=UPI0020CC356E|nr:hypothetical protein [Roseovarius sp. M141]
MGNARGWEEAVRIKEAQIALLHERRQIPIQHAVTTRGRLNPAAPDEGTAASTGSAKSQRALGGEAIHQRNRGQRRPPVSPALSIFTTAACSLIRISGVRGRQVTPEELQFLIDCLKFAENGITSN